MSDYWEDEDLEEGGDDTEFGRCPECRELMDVEAEMCPECGYWLSTKERHKLWDGDSPTRAALSVGQYLLVILLAVLFLGSMLGMFR